MTILETFERMNQYKDQQRLSDFGYRKKKLLLLRELVLEKTDCINKALKEDLAKNSTEVELTETMTIISAINYTLKNLKSWMKIKKVSTPLTMFGAKSCIKYESKGVCLIISPWNYPFQLCLYPLITSFAAGNTSIIKPSEFTPKTNKVIKEILVKVFSENEVTVIEGGVEESTQLLELAFDHIFFTGSTDVGKIVMKAASKNLSSVGLELGGKSPLFLDKNWAKKHSLDSIFWGKFVNAGQTCVAPDYLITDLEDLHVIKDEFKAFVEKAYGKDSLEHGSLCGLIHDRHRESLKKQIDESIKQGAKLEHGGSLIGERHLEPTLLSNVTKDMPIMKDEIFGPILPIIQVKNIDKAIEFINSKPNSLASYIYTNNKEYQDRFVNTVRSGGVAINETLLHVANPHLPFGGAGSSGIGRYHAEEGFAEFSNIKSILKQSRLSFTKQFYPPYTQSKSQLVRKMLKYLKSFL